MHGSTVSEQTHDCCYGNDTNVDTIQKTVGVTACHHSSEFGLFTLTLCLFTYFAYKVGEGVGMAPGTCLYTRVCTQ